MCNFKLELNKQKTQSLFHVLQIFLIEIITLKFNSFSGESESRDGQFTIYANLLVFISSFLFPFFKLVAVSFIVFR